MAQERPNIILINCDDLGYGDLGCYGSTVNKTPALDRMAAEGMRFTDFYMASPVCSPSRGAMMTGCYPPRIGFGEFSHGWVLFPGNPEGLHQDERTVADLLREQGYATKIVGKWHCGDQPEHLPTRHGFDSYYGLPYSNDMGRQSDKRQMQPPPLPLVRDEDVIEQQPDQAALTERYVEECVRFIRDKKDQPFFLYFAHMYVHLPIYAAERFMKQSQNGRYGAGVECVDWSVSVLLHELKTQGLDEKTLVIFTSDNGSRCRDEGGSNAPLRGTKGTTWEGGMRLPCIARWPGTIPAGSVCSEVAASIDFLPTFARLAGTSEPQDRIIDGRDIRPLLTAEAGATSPHEAFFYYFRNDLQAVRSGRWKLFVRRARHDPAHKGWINEEVCELYDLEADIGETSNVADAHPEIVQRLRGYAESMKEDLGCDASGMPGTGRRPVGRVENPQPLTTFDAAYPYYMAEYDLADRG